MTSFANHRFHTLDGMRGIAAIAVMLSHYFMRTNGTTILPAAYISVDFFFILSGFVLQHSYSEKLLRGMTMADYITRRIGRLLPMMLAGLLIGFAAVSISPDHAKTAMRRDYMKSFLCNIAFLPYINRINASDGDLSSLGLIFPLDSPLWSVGLEMLASICMFVLVRMQIKLLMAICGVSFAAILIGSVEKGLNAESFYFVSNVGWATQNICGGYARIFYGFTLGLILYRLRAAQNIKDTNLIKGVITYGFVIAMVGWQILLKGILYFPAILIAAPFLVYKGARLKIVNETFNKVSEFLGWISYPVYCLHVPVLCFSTAVFKTYGMNYGLISTFSILLTAIMVIGLGIIFDKIQIQRRTSKLFLYGFRCLNAI